MESTWTLLILSTLLHSCVAVDVTLKDGATGMVPLEANNGTTVMMTCHASPTQSGGSPSLEWTYSSTANGDQTHVVMNSQRVEFFPAYDRIAIDTYSLQLSQLVTEDTGFYQCRVTIPGDIPSVDSATYNFTVLVPPHSSVSCGFPSDLKITLGHQATFQCREMVAIAVPAAHYNWYKNGVILPPNPGSAPNTSYSYSEITGTLVFSSVVAGDAGTYYCEAFNKVGSSQCAAAEITTKDQDVGLIVGIVFAVIFSLLLIGVLIWWTWKKGYCDGLCDGFLGGKDDDVDGDAPDDGANDIMLDGAGPLVTKEPSEWSNGTSNKQEASMMI